jgi:hypothetical protein
MRVVRLLPDNAPNPILLLPARCDQLSPTQWILSRPADPPDLPSGNQSRFVQKSTLLTAKTAKLVGVNGNQSISRESVNQHSGHLKENVMARKSYQHQCSKTFPKRTEVVDGTWNAFGSVMFLPECEAREPSIDGTIHED